MGSIPKHQKHSHECCEKFSNRATFGPRKAMGGDKGKQSNGRSTWHQGHKICRQQFPVKNPNLHIDTEKNSWSSWYPNISTFKWTIPYLGEMILSFHQTFHPSKKWLDGKNGWFSKFGIPWNPGVYFSGAFVMLVSGSRVYNWRNPLRSIFVGRGMWKKSR